ncbi:MAG: methyltransferase domain-containing protein [Flavobacteriales bacterium]
MTREALNRAEYRNTDLAELIQPECDLVHEYVEDAKQIGGRALEVGPGNGRSVAYLLQNGFTVDVIDNDAEVISILETNLISAHVDCAKLRLDVLDVQRWKPTSQIYAFISISHVLHFLDSSLAMEVLCTLSRGLLSGGLILIRVHSTEHPAAQSKVVSGVTFFRISDFDWLQRSGFTLVHSAVVKSYNSRRSAMQRAKANGREGDADAIAYFTGLGGHIELLLRKD